MFFKQTVNKYYYSQFAFLYKSANFVCIITNKKVINKMEIQEIKQRLKIKTVLQHYGLQMNKNNMLCCPFHEDKTPSMQVYPKTNTWTCFSSNCSAGSGDQIDFIMKHENITKHQAILKAKELIEPEYNNKPTGMSRTEVLTRLFKVFFSGIKLSKAAKEYLYNRNLNSNMEIGYNSGNFHYNNNKNFITSCIKYGLLKQQQKGYSVFAKNCIIFPLKDKQGNIVSIYGRSLQNNPDGTGKPASPAGRHYYLKNRTGLYPKYPSRETQKLILTESIIDAVTLLQIPEITASYEILALYGTNGLTEEHTEAVSQLKQLKEIIFFFDGDEAGKEAVNKYSKDISQYVSNTQNTCAEQPVLSLSKGSRSIIISNIETPKDEDINSLLLGHNPEILTHLIETRAKTQGFVSQEESVKTQGSASQEEKPQGFTSQDIQPKGFASQNVKTQGIASRQLNTLNPEYITYQTKDLLFTLLGGINLQQLDRLRITVKITKNPPKISYQTIRHTIDLYNDDALEKFINKAVERLETETKTLSYAIAEMIEELEQYRLNHIEKMKTKKPQKRNLSPERIKRAINYLLVPGLLKRTNEDIGKTGVIGEETNRLLMYLIFTSRLRENPLHIISLGSSGTGKTYLQEKIADLIPENDKLEITILSENAFYYFDKKELKNKLVLIEDMDGAENVLYPLRELQTKRKISKTIPIKDSKGNLKTITLHVEGPICLAGTTTKERLYEDNANRSLLIYLDNSREHREQIMDYQRAVSAGKVNTKKEQELIEFFKDIQSVLKPVKVRNPYAEQLKIPDYIFKPLRTNSHYLAFIETITFYHQFQRELKTDRETGEKYIETTLEDIESANQLLKDVLLTKSDELPKAVRIFFEGLKYHLRSTEKESFFTKEIRSKLRLNPMTVNRYIRNLESRGYIRKSGGNKKTGFEYEVINWKEYDKLQTGMNVLTEILNRLKEQKAKYNRSITMRDVIHNHSETLVN